MHLPVHFTFDPTIISNNLKEPVLAAQKEVCVQWKLSSGVDKEQSNSEELCDRTASTPHLAVPGCILGWKGSWARPHGSLHMFEGYTFSQGSSLILIPFFSVIPPSCLIWE